MSVVVSEPVKVILDFDPKERAERDKCVIVSFQGNAWVEEQTHI